MIAFPDHRTAAHCVGYMYHYRCLKCSPYAAHIFDAENDGSPAIFPGFCKPFCARFFDFCRAFIPLITNDTAFRALSENYNGAQEFCEKVVISDRDYCFPNLTRDLKFKREINNTFTSKEDCICLERFATGLKNPLIFRYFPDDSGRIAVGEQMGYLHIYYKNGTKIPEPFMDLSDRVLIARWTGDERGFLGLAFHPNFAANRKFYCYFSAMINGRHMTQLSEFKTLLNNPNKVDTSSERVLLQVEQPYSNHNGGETMFGLDGYLYVFLGDGGAGGDPGNRAQNKGTLLGKAIRIDVNVPQGRNDSYLIPPDNPFVNENGTRPEIYAYGIRNIWRCDLDEGDPVTGYGRGRIICGDVGQGRFEEIDIITKGGNYGWNSREGFECYRRQTCGNIGPEILPIHAYSHQVGKSVTGGHVYRGCHNPALNGAYIYGDYVVGKLFKLEETTPGSWTNKQITTCGSDVCFNGLSTQFETNILSFGEDDDGEIYILTTSYANNEFARGNIYKIVDPRRRGDPNKCRSRQRSPQ